MALAQRIDDLIGVFSPVRALKRKASRRAMEVLRMGASNYRGARSSRLTYNWSTGQKSADAAYDGELQTLRDRSRDLNRNNAVASGITDTVCVNTISSTGLTPQSRVDPNLVPANDEQLKIFQKQAETAYAKWSPWSDARLKLTFPEIQFLAMRQILEAGEFLSVRRALKIKQGRPYMLALDIMEPDRLDNPSRSEANTRFGIESNEHGKPVNYHIRKTHPGDTFYDRRVKNPGEYKKVPARDKDGRPIVIHVFPVLRPGQTRGVPFFAPVIEQFKILADYVEAELVGARVAACFAAFVYSEYPYDIGTNRNDDTDDDGNRLETLEPGVIEYLGNNQKIAFAKPDRPGTTFDQFVERILRMIGASLGLPYELVLKDFSKTNYSSARAALLQAYRAFRVWQAMMVNHLCQPMWELLLEEAWLRGELTAPGFRKFKWAYTRAQWIPPRWQSVDPQKEAKANEIALDCGWKSMADVCAEESGGDWEATAEQRAREKKKHEELGLRYGPKTKKEAPGMDEREEEDGITNPDEE